MLSENRTYFPEELSSNGHTFAVTKDYWDDDMSYHARLKQAKAIDLRDNADFIDKGNGYGKLVPKDTKKIYK